MRRLGIWIEKDVEVVMVRPRVWEVGLGMEGGEKALKLDGTNRGEMKETSSAVSFVRFSLFFSLLSFCDT